MSQLRGKYLSSLHGISFDISRDRGPPSARCLSDSTFNNFVRAEVNLHLSVMHLSRMPRWVLDRPCLQCRFRRHQTFMLQKGIEATFPSTPCRCQHQMLVITLFICSGIVGRQAVFIFSSSSSPIIN